MIAKVKKWLRASHLDNFSIKWALIYCSAAFAVAWVFLGNIGIALPWALMGILMERFTAVDRIKKLKREQLCEFREFIDMVNSSMKASDKAVEVSACEAVDSLKEMHMTRSKLHKELLHMQADLKNNNQASFGNGIAELAERMDHDEIRNFSRAVSACYGVNNQGIIGVINYTSMMIEEKNQTEGEIEAAVAESKGQAYIMLFTPAGMLLLGGAMMSDMMNVMRTSAIGMVILLGCLLVNYGMFFLTGLMIRRG